MRARLQLLLIPAALALLLAPPAASARHAGADNPCASNAQVERLGLICPDLRMRAPFDIYMDRSGGRKLLRSGNSIDSMGPGPAELRGRRTAARTMKAKQRVKLRGGGRKSLRPGRS